MIWRLASALLIPCWLLAACGGGDTEEERPECKVATTPTRDAETPQWRRICALDEGPP